MVRPSLAVSIPEIERKAGRDGRRTEQTLPHLNQTDLARRWKLSIRTLERWRWEGRGPSYIKIGSSVRYRIEDVEAFERSNERLSKGSG